MTSRGKKQKVYHIFVDLEQPLERVPKKAIEWALRRQAIPERLIRIVMCLFKDSKTWVCDADGTSELFNIKVGVHHSIINNIGIIVEKMQWG